jgi:hypothetical protein
MPKAAVQTTGASGTATDIAAFRNPPAGLRAITTKQRRGERAKIRALAGMPTIPMQLPSTNGEREFEPEHVAPKKRGFQLPFPRPLGSSSISFQEIQSLTKVSDAKFLNVSEQEDTGALPPSV